MDKLPRSSLSPQRLAANRRNWLLRRGLTEAGRQRLREAALRNRPWAKSTGPRTEQGKTQARINGKLRQKGLLSTREIQAELREIRRLIREFRKVTSVV